MDETDIDKSKFKDDNGRYIVQGLFLEDTYNPDKAYYTFSGTDKTYKGKVFPSLKRLFLEEGDPGEYTFANKYLFDWPHWQRMCKNAVISKHIAQWRDELYLSLRSEGMATMIDLAVNNGSYQAAKWLVDEGWVTRGKGRPSQAEIDGEIKRRAKIEEKFSEEFTLLEEYKKDKKSG